MSMKFLVISCSADCAMAKSEMYVWGQTSQLESLPTTAAEAKRRIAACRKRFGCKICDATLHHVEIWRDEEEVKTYKEVINE